MHTCYGVHILAQEGRRPETILETEQGVASRGGGANRTAGGPGPRPAGLWSGGGQAAAQIRCHCRSCRRGSPAENRHGGAPRGAPVAPGHGGRASHARQTKRVRLSALHPPLVRGAMGLLLPGLPPGLRRPLHRSLGQGRGEQDRQTRAHERAAGTKKAALFDIVSLRPWPTVRFARRDFARSPGTRTHCAISRAGVTLPNVGAAWPVQRKPTEPPSAS
jgi:hypothetical protein